MITGSSLERKYRWSGCSSKISDNVDALSVLRYAMVAAVEYLPLEVIPQLIKGADDGSESLPMVMVDEAFDVFEDEVLRFFGSDDSDDVEEEGSADIGETCPASGDTEGLAWKSANEKIELWKGIGVNGGCVAVVVMVEVLLIGSDCCFVYFGVADALRLDA
jgi:hypothetical protein